MPDRKTVQSAERVFQVLEALAEGGPAALTVLSQHLGLSKSTTHRMLHSLAELGYVRKEEASGKYCLTLKLLEISGRLLEQFDVLPAARRHLEKLMRLTNETVHLVQREGDSIVYIDKVGVRCEFHPHGVARGHAPAAVLHRRRKGHPRGTAGRAGPRDLGKKRRHRLHAAHHHHPGADGARVGGRCAKRATPWTTKKTSWACAASPPASTTTPARQNYAFSISAPVSRMPDARVEELARFVLQVKAELSLELGYAPCRRHGAGAPFPI